jgi:hypothetical protein
VPALVTCAYVASFRFADAGAALTSVNIGLNLAGLFPLFILVTLPPELPATLHFHMIMSALVPSYALFAGSHLVVWQSLSDDNGARQGLTLLTSTRAVGGLMTEEIPRLTTNLSRANTLQGLALVHFPAQLAQKPHQESTSQLNLRRFCH